MKTNFPLPVFLGFLKILLNLVQRRSFFILNPISEGQDRYLSLRCFWRINRDHVYCRVVAKQRELTECYVKV